MCNSFLIFTVVLLKEFSSHHMPATALLPEAEREDVLGSSHAGTSHVWFPFENISSSDHNVGLSLTPEKGKGDFFLLLFSPLIRRFIEKTIKGYLTLRLGGRSCDGKKTETDWIHISPTDWALLCVSGGYFSFVCFSKQACFRNWSTMDIKYFAADEAETKWTFTSIPFN